MLPLSTLQGIVAQQPHPLLFATISGAHLYGFPSSDSDWDLRGVHVLPLTQVLGLTQVPETIEVSAAQGDLELDLVTHDIKKFFSLLLKRNGYVLEQLYSPLVVHTNSNHEQLKCIAQGCITRYHSHHYLGFAKTQWRFFSKTTPHSVKPLLYVYRVLLTGIHLMQTGEVEANLNTLNQKFQLSCIPELIERKQVGGEQVALAAVDMAFHQGEYERLTQVLEQASQVSHLPSESSAQPALHDLLLQIRIAK